VALSPDSLQHHHFRQVLDALGIAALCGSALMRVWLYVAGPADPVVKFVDRSTRGPLG
jgi:hypothetical protein